MRVEAEALGGAGRTACEAFLDAVPDELAGESRREVVGDTSLGRAWGDPALVLTCGAGDPPEFDRFSSCLEVNGVGWFAPPSQDEDQESDVLLTAVGHRPRVSLLVPAERRGEGVAAALTALAGPVEDHLELVDECA